MYHLKIKPTAERDLQKLPRPLFLRLSQKILALAEEPRPDGVRKLSGSLEGWRIRVGDYRVVYQIDDEQKTVIIVRVRHRRDVYGP
jgi:mRNA interferase RelE/StbE